MRCIAALSAVLILAAGPALAACPSGYVSGAAFPPVAADGRLPAPARILELAGGRGWGIEENVRIIDTGEAAFPQALEIRIPKGSVNPRHPTAPKGGMGFRWRPGIPPSATAACLSYRLWLPPGYPFNKGGKLPGLFGGSGPAGGRTADGRGGFSIRPMWRSGGRGELYAYIPGHPAKRGQSIDRGAFSFPTGRWVELTLEIGLNTPEVADGYLRLSIDGEVKISLTEVFYRHDASLGLAGVMADVFFGGKDLAWAAPADTFVRLTPFGLNWR